MPGPRLPCIALAASLIAAGSAAVLASSLDLGTPDERLRHLFTPWAAPAATYEVFRSARPIAALAAELRARDPAPRADAWAVRPLAPLDAFGSSAPYDASRLARLYVEGPPLVARGSLRTADGVVGYTLISPWPDADLASLQPGTLVVVVHVTRLTGLR
jgi:hypothetical protein